MNIAIFADNFYPQVNGVVTVISNLADGLAKKGHKILIIAPKYRNVKYPTFHPNVKVITVASIPAIVYPGLKWTLSFHQKVAREVLKNKIDIVHFHAPMSLGMEAIALGKILKIPVIGTFHTFFADEQYLRHIHLDYQIIKKMSWRYNNLYYNRCALVTSPTSLTKDILQKNKLKKPIKVISNGIDPDVFDNSKSKQIRQKYNPDGPLCLFVGRIAHEKNLLFLVDAFAKVLQKVPSAKLLIVGGGPQEKEVANQIKKLKLQDRIIMTGQINHDQLIKSGIYGACDLFVTASKTENQSVTVLEAQINGLPCVGLKAMGMPDLIKNQVTGLIVEPDKLELLSKAIIKLLSDKNLYSKIKISMQDFIKKHLFSAVLNEWEKTYQKVIEQYQKNPKNKPRLRLLLSRKSS